MSISILLGIIAFAILAVVNIFDKFVLEKRVSPQTFVFYSTIFLLPSFLIIPFGVRFFDSWVDWFLAVFCAFTFAFSLWTLYIGLGKSEASHFVPFVGASIPVFLLGFSSIFLGEQFTQREIVSMAFLIIGSFIISIGAVNKHFLFWGSLTGLLVAGSQVSAKYLYDAYGFFSAFIWTRAVFLGVFGILLLFSKVVRSETMGKPKERTGQKNIWAVVADKILGVVGIIILQYAIALGSVTIISALAGVQFAVLIILIFLLSKFLPKFFKEHYVKMELSEEFLAIFLIAIGLAVLVW